MQTHHAANYANQILADLGETARIDVVSDAPEIVFYRSGLAELSQPCPAPIAAAANGVMLALNSLSPDPKLLPENGAVLLGERARLLGLQGQGRISANGSCRLIDASDGRLALNMARDDDWDLMSAWLETEASDWDSIIPVIEKRSAIELVRRGQEMGLAVSLDEFPERPAHFFKAQSFEAAKNNQPPLVVDLSSLWAGPLCGSLLGMMGARVVKVESQTRPDGARRGNIDFYNLLNAGKEGAVFDFQNDVSLSELKTLIESADIVIEASRPRALRQLGIIAEDMLTAKPGKVWLSFTAYGRHVDAIGFGDDIGIAAGLTRVIENAYGPPSFVGDAIADPLSGLHGALAVWSLWQQGGGVLIDLSMRDVVRYAMGNDFTFAKMVKGKTLYPMRAIPKC